MLLMQRKSSWCLMSIMPLFLVSTAVWSDVPGQDELPNTSGSKQWLVANQTSLKRSVQRQKARRPTSRPTTRTTFGLGADVGMVHINTGYGLELWVGQETGFQAGLQWLTASDTWKGGQQDDTTHLVEQMNVNLQQTNAFLRLPLVDVLYVTLNVAMNTIRGKYGFNGLAPDQPNSYVSYTYTSIAPSLAIGSQWLYSNGFFLGIDWVGYSVPLSSKVKISAREQSAEAGMVYDRVALYGDQTPSGIVAKNIKDNYGIYYTLARCGFRF